MPHGGPEARDYYDSWVQYFAARGYQILQINFRGSSGFGREFAKAGYGEWGGLMQNDIIDATQYGASSLDPRRIWRYFQYNTFEENA